MTLLQCQYEVCHAWEQPACRRVCRQRENYCDEGIKRIGVVSKQYGGYNIVKMTVERCPAEHRLGAALFPRVLHVGYMFSEFVGVLSFCLNSYTYANDVHVT